MVPDRVANSEVHEYFVAKWNDGLENGLPASNPPLSSLEITKNGVPYLPTLVFRNVELRSSRPTDEHFARFTLSNLSQEQRTLTGGVVQGVRTKYETNGVGAVELFFCKSNYSTQEETYLKAISHEAFLHKRTTNVVFRNAVIIDLPEEEKYYRSIVTFEYEFDTHV